MCWVVREKYQNVRKGYDQRLRLSDHLSDEDLHQQQQRNDALDGAFRVSSHR